MAWEILRTVVEAVRVSEKIDELSATFERFPEAWEALKWFVARNPTPKDAVRRVVGETQYWLYVLAGDDVANTPELWVVYRHSDTEIDILGIQAVESPSEDDLE